MISPVTVVTSVPRYGESMSVWRVRSAFLNSFKDPGKNYHIMIRLFIDTTLIVIFKWGKEKVSFCPIHKSPYAVSL